MPLLCFVYRVSRVRLGLCKSDQTQRIRKTMPLEPLQQSFPKCLVPAELQQTPLRRCAQRSPPALPSAHRPGEDAAVTKGADRRQVCSEGGKESC